MIKKTIVCLLTGLLSASTFCQANLTDKDAAIAELKGLKTGVLVVRLKTNDKSVDAYRKAGKNEVADRIVEERKAQNRQIIYAFRKQFDFCKVSFIYAKNTDQLLKGSGNIFLNDTLGMDPTISLKEKYFLIAEYGTVNSNMREDEYHYSGVEKTEASASTATTSAIFISDTTLAQLRQPFPFYVEVTLDNYVRAVAELNKLLYKAYYHFLDKEYKESLKKKMDADSSKRKP